MLDHSQNN